MYAADWTNRCGGNTIQSYFTGTSTELITYADYSERITKNLAPVIAATPDLADVHFLWAVNIWCWIKIIK